MRLSDYTVVNVLEPGGFRIQASAGGKDGVFLTIDNSFPILLLATEATIFPGITKVEIKSV